MSALTIHCPRCGYPGPDPRAQRAGAKGGLAKVRKGFAARPDVLRRVLEERQNRDTGQRPCK